MYIVFVDYECIRLHIDEVKGPKNLRLKLMIAGYCRSVHQLLVAVRKEILLKHSVLKKEILFKEYADLHYTLLEKYDVSKCQIRFGMLQ